VLLTDFLRSPVNDADGFRIGRLGDLAFLPDSARPRVTALVVDGRRIPWRAVLSFSEYGVTVRGESAAVKALGELEIARDILDDQIFDVAGKRLTRVGDVVLEPAGGPLVLAGVEIGARPVVRRLGMRRLASRLARERIEWRELHHAALPGHPLRLQHAREKYVPPGRRYGRVLSLRRRGPS